VTVELLIKVVVVAFAVAAFWLAFRPRYVFRIRIEAGVPGVASGKVTAAFLLEIAEVCRQLGVRRGWVGGVRRGRKIVLAFSRGMPPAAQQRLRNLWTLKGWT
jgi:hypothetical protein